MAEKKSTQKTAKVANVASSPTVQASGHGDSRASLLAAAVRVFASKGFEGTTVKDLADEAGVNVSLVSYYFGGKEGLYRTCIETFGLERVSATERILKAPSSPEEFRLRLRLFAEEFMQIYLKDPDMIKLVHRALDMNDSITQDLFNNVFLRMFTALVSFLQSAQQSQFMRENLDIEITASLLFGSLTQFIRSDEMCKWTGRRTLSDVTFMDEVIEHWVNQNMIGFAFQGKE
jgi:AcrR family transcriptional regulator